MSEVLGVLTIGNLVLSVAAGLLAGGYLAVFHPTIPERGLGRRALLQGWYFGFLGSILYVARVAFAIARQASDPAEPTDIGRVVGGWLLWLLFAAFVGVGAYAAGVVRERRQRA